MGILIGKAEVRDNEWRSQMIFNKADFSQISDEFFSVNWDYEMSGLNTQECYEIFIKKYDEACTNFVPTARPGSKRKSEPWIDNTICEIIRLKHTTWYKMNQNGNRAEYRNVSKRLKRLIYNAKKQFERDIASRSKREPKLVHAYVRSKMIVKDQIRGLKNNNGVLVTDTSEMADILAKQFHSVFVEEPQTHCPSLQEELTLNLATKMFYRE